MSLLFCLIATAADEEAKFQGVWKGEFEGHTYALVTILGKNPLRGTIAKGTVRTGKDGAVIEVTRDSAMDLFIQNPRMVKKSLHFKTIDPNDEELDYVMKIVSDSAATLTVKGTTLHLQKH